MKFSYKSNEQRLTRTTALRPIDRRTVLRGVGTAALALPWLEGMARPQAAHAAGVPKRLVVFFSPNGTIRDNWLPTGTETDFKLGRILVPLEDHQKDIVVIDGLDQMQGGAGDNHMRGMGGMLTGMPINPGPWSPGAGGWANGISVDQEIANKISGGSKFRSLELGVQSGQGGVPGNAPVSVWTRMCYAGADKPLHPENSPSKAFNRVFGELDVGASPTETTRLRARRRSIIDATRDAYSSLLNTLGGDDKKRLGSHLSAIREIETSVANSSTVSVCKKPEAPSDGGGFAAIGKTQMDLMVRALACDVTRVTSVQWSHSVGGGSVAGLPRENHHELSHAGDSDLVAKEGLTAINTWYAQQFAYLLAKMKEVPEGGGTLLDNSLVIWVNELAKGNAHSGKNAMYVLAGHAGGALKTGRFLTYPPRTPHNNLLVSILNLMDVPATTFGLPAWCMGPLPKLA